MVPLAVVALGVVVGFPLLTALALKHVTSAHSIVFIGLLPLATAAFAVLRGGERPRAPFWLFSLLGSALVSGFAYSQSSSAASVEPSSARAASPALRSINSATRVSMVWAARMRQAVTG